MLTKTVVDHDLSAVVGAVGVVGGKVRLTSITQVACLHKPSSHTQAFTDHVSGVDTHVVLDRHQGRGVSATTFMHVLLKALKMHAGYIEEISCLSLVSSFFLARSLSRHIPKRPLALRACLRPSASSSAWSAVKSD